MHPKRWSVWLGAIVVALGLSDLRAQDVLPETDLIDDVSGRVPKAVTTVPPVPATEQRQIRLDVQIVELDLDRLPAVTSETSKRERIEALAKKLGWIEQHRRIVWHSESGLDLKKTGLKIEDVGKVLCEPTMIVRSGQEASFLSGGEIIVRHPNQPEKAVDLRPFGFSMKCIADVSQGSPMRLNLKFENSKPVSANTEADWIRAMKPLYQAADNRSPEPSVPVIIGQTASITTYLPLGKSVVLALPLNGNHSDKIVFVCVTPEIVTKSDVVEITQAPMPKPMPVTGQGLNSDAGVTGNVVVEDRATLTKLEAKSVSVEVADVSLSHGVSRAKPVALIAAKELDDVRVLLPRATLLVAKNMQVKKGQQAGTVTLEVQGFADADAVKNSMQRNDGETLLLIALPDEEPLTKEVVRRTLEHDLARDEIERVHRKGDEPATHLIEVTAGQKSVRVPIMHETFLLLSTPTGNLEGMRYVSQVRSDKPAVKQLSGLTVMFVSESCLELERLVRELEPTSNITVVEVRDAVLLRGTVSDAEQRRSLIEIAQQFYPKVLDQLRVEKSATDTEQSAASRRPEQANRVLLPSNIQQAKAEQTTPAAEPAGNTNDIEAATAALRRRRLTPLAPHKLPSIEELKELRDEVKGLRRDVQRLSEQLERDRHAAKTRADEEARRKIAPSRRESTAADTSNRQSRGNQDNTQLAPRSTAETLQRIRRLQGEADAVMDANEVESIVWYALGMQLETLNEAQRKQVEGRQFRGGLAVGEVRNPDLTHGPQRGDILVAVDHWETTSLRDLQYVLTRDDSLKAKSLTYFVIRNNEVRSGTVVPGGDNPRQAKLLLQLDRVIHVAMNGTLEEALQQLKKTAGINCVIDKEGLEEVGVTPGHAVGMTLTGIPVRSVLNVLLKDVSDNLGWVVEDDVVKITSKVRTLGALVTKTYPVADLIVPLPEARKPLNLTGEWQRAADVKEELPIAAPNKKPSGEVLIKLLTETVQPDSWSEVGGEGSLQFHEGTLSLVIRQRAAVHEEIAELLQQLRRLQDLQVSVEMRLMHVSETVAKQIGKDTEQALSADKTKQLIGRMEQDRHGNTLVLPKVTLFNGQSVQMQHDGDEPHSKLCLQMIAAASGDREAVRLAFDIGESFEKLTRHSGETLKDGESLLLDVTSEFTRTGQLLRQLPIGNTEQTRQLAQLLHPGAKGRIVLLVTPRAIKVEEEESISVAR